MKQNLRIKQKMKKKNNSLRSNIFVKFVCTYMLLMLLSTQVITNFSYAKKVEDKESSDVESQFLTSIDMMLEILKEDSDISDYANTYQYIYYKYTNDENYKTELDFSSYDTSGFSNVGDSSTSGSSFKQFKKWLHGWEGGSVSSDGKFYIVESDGSATGSAVGHGVDIGVHGAELRAAGYSTTIGSKIPVDVVDAIEEKEINGKISAVKSKTNGLNLTEYQIYALVSRAYNCGVAGAFTTRNGKDFKAAYNAYWKQDRDDKYGHKESVDYNQKLYSEYMKDPQTSGGQYLAGLENRRKSEWVLFQTGWFDERGNVNAYCSKNKDSVDSDSIKLTGKDKEKMQNLIARAIEIANDEDYQYYTYSQPNRYGEHSFDCSSFCARLYKKYFNISIPSTTSGYGSTGYVGNVGSVELQPGDILWREGHVELYIGNNKRAGAHKHYPNSPKDDISIEKGLPSGSYAFTKVDRFVK